MTRAYRITDVRDRWSEWDAFVNSAPDSTFAHRSGWHRLVHELFGHDSRYRVAEDTSGVWRGALPLVHLRGVLGHYLLSMPFLNDGGPIGDADARTALAADAVNIAQRTKAKVLELRTRSTVDSVLSTSTRKVAVHLPLPESVEALWEKTFKAKLRSQIRRPTKEGMRTRTGIAELDAFYEVFCRNMRDLGTPVLPRMFFELLAREFGSDVLFCTVYSAAGDPAAAACCLRWRDEMEITWASSLREFNPLSPNMLLYASVMEAAIREKVRTFNFGRSTPGAPTHRFKLQWGGQDVPLPWAVWPSPNTHGEERSATLRAAVAVWRHLPLAIANRVGPLVSGQLPW